ncbi:MAG: response regulator [Acidobacteriota bacterium]|jgi:CheY-like chemotaxis protein
MTEASLKRILLVEDEADIQLVARIALERLGGFELEICSSGEEALERASELAPQLILLDIVLPGLGGLETLAELRKIPSLRTTPVVVLTARVRTDEVAEYEERDVAAVIPKPFDPLLLGDRLRRIWESHRG